MDKKLEDQIREFLNIPDCLSCNESENSYGYWYDFAVNLHRAAQTANHEWMAEIIYPKIKLIFNKHDGEALTYTLLDTIKQELDRLREQVIESTSNDYMSKFVFDDCVIQKLISLFQDPYYFRIVRSHLLGENVQNEESDKITKGGRDMGKKYWVVGTHSGDISPRADWEEQEEEPED